MKQRGRVTYEDSLNQAIAFDVGDLHGASGGPVLDRQGRVVGVMDEAYRNLAFMVKLKYLNELLSAYINDASQGGFTLCSARNSYFDCLNETLVKLEDMADRGNTIAQYQSWMFYGHGRVTTPLQRAADNGFAPALHELALILGKENDKESRRRSHDLLMQAAGQGYALAQCQLVFLSYYGERIEGVNPMELLRRAAEQGLMVMDAEQLLRRLE